MSDQTTSNARGDQWELRINGHLIQHTGDMTLRFVDQETVLTTPRTGATPLGTLVDHRGLELSANFSAIDKATLVSLLDLNTAASVHSPKAPGSLRGTVTVRLHQVSDEDNSHDVNMFAAVVSFGDKAIDGVGADTWPVTFRAEQAASGAHAGKTWNLSADLAS